MVKQLFLFATFALFSTFASAQEQPQLIIFSGSDWCNNCLRLKKAVLEDPQVKTFIAEHYELVEADFPRDDSHLSKEEIKRNEMLADKYNANGYFPTVVIVKNGEEVAKKSGYSNELPDSYMQWLKENL